MTNKKSDCGCLYPILPCLYTLNTDDILGKRQSNEIDRQLALDKKDYVRTHRLLLLGAGESGKSTIIKQMQLIHVDNFSDSVRRQRRDDIRSNLLEAIVSILAAMSVIHPPVKLEDGEHERMAKWILDNGTKQNFDYPPEFYQYTEILWKDKGVQATFLRNNEYQLIDSAKYFLNKIKVISQNDYMPTDQDILRCRVLTTGIYELTFHVKNVKFRIIDVGGQRDERRKWFLCFNDVTAIIFVTACSSYDMVLREDASKNRLCESLELFKVVWNNRWLGHISVILFLNKQDIFREKILSGRSKLEDYFPTFKDYHIGPISAEDGDEPIEVVRAKYFIKNEFQKISLMSRNVIDHRLFPHFTCAVDTENIKRVFDDCRDTIQRKYLKDCDLI